MGLRGVSRQVKKVVSQLILITPLLCIAVGPGVLRAQDVSRIAAIVNEEIISVLDLVARIDLTIFTTGFPNTPDTRRGLSGQVLRALVDERLQLQEANRLGVRINNREIDVQLRKIEHQNGVAQGKLDEYLRQRGLKKYSLTAQLQARITWTKTLQRELRRQISVSDEEVDEELRRLEINQGLVQNRVVEILLTIDTVDQENDVRKVAENLVQQIRSGAHFNTLARQFSRSASAASGGELGWVAQGQLNEALEQALKELTPGQISDPIRTYAGYYILMLRDQRTPQSSSQDTLLELYQLVIPIKAGANDAEIETKKTLAKNTRSALTSCSVLPELAKTVGFPQSGSLGKIAIKDLPAKLRHAVINLAAGDVSEPIVTNTGVLLLMVCNREEKSIELPTRQQIQSKLGFNKLDLLGRRYMRDLRRSAFVEYRI